MKNPFRYLNSSPEIIRLTVMLYIRYPLSLRQVEDLLFKRGIDICHETMRFWWNRFGPMFAAEVQRRRIHHHSHSNWRWHLDEVFVQVNGETGIVRLTRTDLKNVQPRNLRLQVDPNQPRRLRYRKYAA
jgi:putative transposase